MVLPTCDPAVEAVVRDPLRWCCFRAKRYMWIRFALGLMYARGAAVVYMFALLVAATAGRVVLVLAECTRSGEEQGRAGQGRASGEAGRLTR